MNTSTKPIFKILLHGSCCNVSPSQRWTQPGCNDAFAECTQQEAVSAFGVNQSNVQQLNMRLHQLDSADYTPGTGCQRVIIPRQDPQIHFKTVEETASTIAGQGNQCASVQTVRNRLWGAILCARLRTFELLLKLVIAPLVVPYVHQRNLTLQMLRTTQSHMLHGCTKIFYRHTKGMFSNGQRSHQTLIQQNIFQMSW
jgi:hypothetical protein